MDTKDKCWQDYRNIIETHTFLSREEELKTVSLLDSNDSKIKQEARNNLFNSNLRLVLKEAHAYHKKTNNNFDFLDLVNSGSVGLAIAIERFDPKKYNTRLTTYSIPWIRLEITKFINSNSRCVYVPTHLVHKSHKYKKIIREAHEGNSSELTDKELKNKLEVSENGLKYIRMSQGFSVSMDSVLDVNGENTTTLKDTIADTSPTPDKNYLDNERKNDILKAVNGLTPIEQSVLKYRYLDDDDVNLSVIGKKLGICGERVRQVEYKAFRKLRRRLKGKFDKK